MKKLFYTFVMLFSVLGIYAQTDVTDYISDPDFEKEGRSVWKTNSFGRQTNTSFELKHGEAYREVWSGGTAGDAYIYQDLSGLPVGTYTLTVTAQNIKQSDKSLVCTGTWIYANDQQTEFNKPGDYTVTCVVKDGNLRVGAEIKSCTGNYVCIDNFRLAYQLVYDDVKDYVEEMMNTVDKIDQHNTSAERTEMIEARDNLKALIEGGQQDKLSDAVKRLESAITAYNFSLASPTNPMDVTSMITNPGFESGDTGWKLSNMGTQGNSDFPGKVGSTYVESWTSGGNKVSDGYVKQTISNLPNGRYKLTANAWNVQQSNTSTKQTGAYIFIDNYTTAVNVNNNYSVEGICVAGEITIGYKNEGATGNYTCVDNFKLQYLGSDAEAEAAAFNKLIETAEALLEKEMNTADKTALESAIGEGKAATTITQRAEATTALNAAINSAKESIALYTQLNSIIQTGEKALASGKPNGQERLQTALNSANNMKASGAIDADMVATAKNMVDNGIFAYNVLNGTGTTPKAVTGEVIVGGNGMVGRMSASGSNIIERGFCWAENPNPTVLDDHTSFNYSNDETNYSPVYIMYGVKASTEYWVRAYAMTSTYAVGYGEPVRVITLPQGTTEYTYLWNGDDDHNMWLDNAMKEACEYYNIWTAIKGFHPTANYSPGTETADCSYGGWINVGPWRCNTGTMVHEMMHGTGVGQHGRWWSAELHNLDKSVVWLGERGNRVCHFFENYDPNRGNYNCNGDGMHVCYEGNGNDMQQIRSAILMQALYEDGLPAVSDGACPFYSFESYDTIKYYITNDAFGTNEKYLRESTTGKLAYSTVSQSELLENDAFAWNVIYDKMTGLYYLRNVQSGKYFSYSSSIQLKNTTTLSKAEQFQLMPARIYRTLTYGSKTFDIKPYWVARGSRAEYPEVMAVTSKTATTVSNPTLDFSNNATTQYWMIFTADQLNEIAEAKNEMNKDRINRLIEGSKQMAAVEHEDLAEGVTSTFTTTYETIESEKDTYTTSETENAVTALYDNILTFAPQVKLNEPIDMSFMMDDPELNTGIGWEGLPELNNGRINITNGTETFTATCKIASKMPKGTYGILVRGFHRPGDLTNSMKDWAAGTNLVTTYITVNTKSYRMMHMGDGGQETKLGQGGTERLMQGVYVPSNINAAAAYINNGIYDNLIAQVFNTNATLTVGVKKTLVRENDWTFIEDFKILYYGYGVDKDVVAVDEVEDIDEAEVQGYYNAAGMQVSEPVKGVTLVRMKDGQTKKVFK